MKTRSSLVRLAALAVFVSPLAGAQVPLHTAPDDAAAVVARVAANDPVVTSGSPALGVTGWQWGEYGATLRGHVPAARVGKNFAIDPDTPLRAAGDAAAPVLARVQPDDAVEIVASNEAWIEIRLSKTVPVYFRKPAGPAPKRATPGAGPAPAEPGPVDIDPPAATDTAAETPATSIVVSESEASKAQPPRKPRPPAGTPMRVLSGTLERGRGADSGPRFTLSLRHGGRRLAYVDISRLYVRDLRPYLGNEVIVMGEVSSISPGGSELVIHARTLRLKP